MNNLNVFNQHFFPIKYPSNWIPNIKLFLRQFKWAYQRITQGYCDNDIWNLDWFLLKVLSNTLCQLANTTISYPGTEEFSTFDSWTTYLRRAAVLFAKADESNEELLPNPAYQKWAAAIEDKNFLTESNTWKDPCPDLSAAMIKEQTQLQEQRMQYFQQAWNMIGKYFFHLWD